MSLSLQKTSWKFKVDQRLVSARPQANELCSRLTSELLPSLTSWINNLLSHLTWVALQIYSRQSLKHVVGLEGLSYIARILAGLAGAHHLRGDAAVIRVFLIALFLVVDGDDNCSNTLARLRTESVAPARHQKRCVQRNRRVGFRKWNHHFCLSIEIDFLRELEQSEVKVISSWVELLVLNNFCNFKNVTARLEQCRSSSNC